MVNYEEIYPQVSGDGKASDVNNFRLHQSAKYLSDLERELHDRERIHKKYKRSHGILMKISVSSGTLSIILSGSGVGTSLTGFGLPVGLSLASIGGFCGIISVLAGIFAKKISPKLSKHERTASICAAEVNTLKDIVSKALDNNKISHEEFKLVKDVIDKYGEMKKHVRMRHRSAREGAQPSIDKLKNQIRTEFMEKLQASNQ